MNVGDIFGVYENPCPQNNLSRVLGIELPYFGIITQIPRRGDPNFPRVRTKIVYKDENNRLHHKPVWYFKPEELTLIDTVV